MSKRLDYRPLVSSAGGSPASAPPDAPPPGAQAEAEAAAAAARAAAGQASEQRDRFRSLMREAEARLAQSETDKSALLDYVTDLQEADKTEECLELQDLLQETRASLAAALW